MQQIEFLKRKTGQNEKVFKPIDDRSQSNAKANHEQNKTYSVPIDDESWQAAPAGTDKCKDSDYS